MSPEHKAFVRIMILKIIVTATIVVSVFSIARLVNM